MWLVALWKRAGSGPQGQGSPLAYGGGGRGLAPRLRDVTPKWQDLIHFDQRRLKGAILSDEKSHLLWF